MTDFPPRRTDDLGQIELQNLIARYDVYAARRSLNSNNKQNSKLRTDAFLIYAEHSATDFTLSKTFENGISKSHFLTVILNRDFILCSNGLRRK